MLDKYTIIEPFRAKVIYNWLQYFSRKTILAELASAGLIVDSVFSDVKGTPFNPNSDEFAVIAGKP